MISYWREYQWLRRIRRSEKPIVYIYQMAKVGSSTVYYSLRSQIKRPIVHSHDFTPWHRLPEVRALHRAYHFDDQLPVQLISLVRDPIHRNLSAFFQDYERFVGHPFDPNRVDMDEWRRIFLERVPHEFPLRWMDRIKAHFGIDVYSQSFPAEGYIRYPDVGRVSLLIMRHDLPNQEKSYILSDYLETPPLEIRNFNVTAPKEYGSAYQAFKKQLVLPEDYLDRMAQSRYFQHFYSTEEIKAVLNEYR